MFPCELVTLNQPLCNLMPLAWKPHWRLKSPRPVKSVQQELTESELGKWVCYSPWLGLQFFAVLPVFQPSPDSGNSRDLMGIHGNLGNSRDHLLELGIPRPQYGSTAYCCSAALLGLTKIRQQFDLNTPQIRRNSPVINIQK